MNAIAQNPNLFKIVTPIKVDVFERLLATHPNQPLVQSVCQGLREGFWPFANVKDDAPSTRDFSYREQNEESAAFIRAHRDEEIAVGRFSESFGPDLLPGMYTMPISAVPKPGTEKLRMVFDASAGPFSPNSFILKRDAHIRLDNLQDFGVILRSVRKQEGCSPTWLFKSDVSHAYPCLPCHPLWQLKQVMTIDGLNNLNRTLAIGNRASGRIWCTFMELVIWIAIYIKMLLDLLHYIDDAWSYELLRQLVYDEPYDSYYPAKQVGLLRLWDEIGLPHSKPKQVFGSVLDIIDLTVNLSDLSITMLALSKADLVSAIRMFIDATVTRRHTLLEWQRLLGWINWALNAFPLLKPGLQSFCGKLAGKQIARAFIYVNKAVVTDLSWVADTIEHSAGVFLLDAIQWQSSEADLEISCDACMSGMGFYCPARNVAFYAKVPEDVPIADIYFFESLCVVSALLWATTISPLPRRLLIRTDSLDAVEMFHSLKACTGYNNLLLYSVRLLMDTNISLPVFHIDGTENVIADALSRALFALAASLNPGLHLFQPPQDALGVAGL